MVIGYVLLGLLAIMMFFGVLNTTIKSMRLKPWLALFFTIALIVGGVIPFISFGENFSLSIGGVVVPVVMVIVLHFFVGANKNLLKLILAEIVITGIVMAIEMFMPMGNIWFSLLTTFTMALIAGAVAFAICRDKLATVTAAIGGIVFGHIAGQLTLFFMGTSTSIVLGYGIIFDAIVVGMVFAFILSSVKIQVDTTQRGRLNTAVEAGEEHQIEEELKKYDDFFDEE